MRRVGWQPKGCLRKRSKGRVGQGQVERQGRPCRGRYEPRGGDEAGGSPQGRERRQARSGLQGCNREVRRARRRRQRCVREQREGAIRQVLRSRQVSPAAFGCGRREESGIAARVVFSPAVLTEPTVVGAIWPSSRWLFREGKRLHNSTCAPSLPASATNAQTINDYRVDFGAEPLS